MISKGIRGAIIVDENSPEAIGAATIRLLKEMLNRNKIETDMISHVIFTLTKDLNADFEDAIKFSALIGFFKVYFIYSNALFKSLVAVLDIKTLYITN